MPFCIIGSSAANAHVPVGSDLPVDIVWRHNVCGVFSMSCLHSRAKTQLLSCLVSIRRDFK